MNEAGMYDQFSRDYDRFVNWDARLAVEMPFLSREIAELKPELGDTVRVLDAACGTGRHAIALADRGSMVAGADFSPGMVEAARENANAAGQAISFKSAGFGGFTHAFGERVFDAVICLGNSLPHVLTETTLEQALGDFHRVLRSGGKLILQNRNFDRVLAIRERWMPPETYREGNRVWVFARFYDFNPDGRLTFNIQVLTGEDGEAFHQRVISTRLWPMKRDELVGALEKAGFKDLRLFGDLEGTAFDPENSMNLVVTAKR